MTDIKTLVVDDIIKEAKIIFNKSKAYKKEHGIKKGKHMELSDKQYDDLIKTIQKEHNQFINVYAVVVKSIVYGNKFYDKALERYVNHLRNHPWKERSEFIDRQADWYVFMERERNPRIGQHTLAQYRDEVRRRLHAEDEEFMKHADIMKKQVEDEREDILDDRRARLLETVKALKAQGLLKPNT